MLVQPTARILWPRETAVTREDETCLFLGCPVDRRWGGLRSKITDARKNGPMQNQTLYILVICEKYTVYYIDMTI